MIPDSTGITSQHNNNRVFSKKNGAASPAIMTITHSSNAIFSPTVVARQNTRRCRVTRSMFQFLGLR